MKVMSRPTRNNGDVTVNDLNTGLVWTKAVDRNKVSLIEAKVIAERMTLGGYSDWRVPNIKELYSLIGFRGYTGFNPGGGAVVAEYRLMPYPLSTQIILTLNMET